MSYARNTAEHLGPVRSFIPDSLTFDLAGFYICGCIFNSYCSWYANATERSELHTAYSK